jgi:uncharacterized protein (UPF0297 family)
MIEQILRAPLPDQIKALLEKLDNELDASSLQKVNAFVRTYAAYLTRYERMMLRRAIRRINRELLMNEAMAIVINTQPEVETWAYPSSAKTLTIEQIQRDTLQILEKEFVKGYKDSALGRANSGLYADVKREAERVNY